MKEIRELYATIESDKDPVKLENAIKITLWNAIIHAHKTPIRAPYSGLVLSNVYNYRDMKTALDNAEGILKIEDIISVQVGVIKRFQRKLNLESYTRVTNLNRAFALRDDTKDSVAKKLPPRYDDDAVIRAAEAKKQMEDAQLALQSIEDEITQCKAKHASILSDKDPEKLSLGIMLATWTGLLHAHADASRFVTQSVAKVQQEIDDRRAKEKEQKKAEEAITTKPFEPAPPPTDPPPPTYNSTLTDSSSAMNPPSYAEAVPAQQMQEQKKSPEEEKSKGKGAIMESDSIEDEDFDQSSKIQVEFQSSPVADKYKESDSMVKRHSHGRQCRLFNFGILGW